MNMWTVSEDGFASGPSRVVEGAGREIVVSAVWSDEDGVCVALDLGDEPVPAHLAIEVIAAIAEMSAMPAPECSAT